MGAAIGQVLIFAVGVALSPIPIVAVVLMLATPRGRLNGAVFVLAWVVGIALVGTIVLLLSGGASASDHAKPATWVSILKLLGGVGLLALALRQYRERPRGDAPPKLPTWMKRVDRFDARRSAALGFGLCALNPKNLIFIAGAAATIAQTGASAGKQAVALLIVVIVGSLGVALPVAIFFVMGERGQHILDGLRVWMARENAVIIAVLCLLIGVKLIGDAIVGFTS